MPLYENKLQFSNDNNEPRVMVVGNGTALASLFNLSMLGALGFSRPWNSGKNQLFGNVMRYEEFDDFDAFTESIRDIDSRMILLNAKRRLWTSFGVDLHGVDVQIGQLGSGNLGQAALRPDGYFLYLPLTPGVEYLANGVVLADNSFAVVEPGSEFCISTKEPHDWCAVFLPMDALPDLSVLRSHSPSGQKRCWVTRPNRMAADRFRRATFQIRETATSCPDFETTEAGRIAAGAVSRAAKLALGLRETSKVGAEGRPKMSRQQIIRRCMEFLEERSGSPVVVADLSGAASVSERTLRSAFHEFFGVGPVRYLCLRRLNRIHRALRAAEREETTVTETLVEHGEWDFGRFASNYRQLFGELPSETLRKKSA